MNSFSYSSDMLPFPEANRSSLPSTAVAVAVTSRDYSLIESESNVRQSESNVRQQQQQQHLMNLRKTHQCMKSISKLPATIPFQRISFEKHQIL